MARKKKYKGMTMFEWFVTSLVIIGAINWGLIGVTSLMGDSVFNLVDVIFGVGSTLVNIIYVLVGVSGVYSAYRLLNK